MRVFLLISITLLVKICCGQDSTTAIYISDAIQKIEGRISTDIMEQKDTSIFDDGDSLQKGAFLSVHTEFYTDPKTMLLDKIVEKSLYKKTITELTIYFLGNNPIQFSNKQWEGSTVRYDFTIYYMSDTPVFIKKGTQITGTPDGDAYLKWCYDLRREYFGIVNEYNQTFTKAKSKLR